MAALDVVMHVHSDWSYDGSWPLASLARLFKRAGADLVLMTEHEDTFDEDRFEDYRQACAEASAGGTILVPGIEYASPDNSVHILSWGLRRFHGKRRPVMEILEGIAEEGGFAVLAHPMRRAAWQQYRDEWAPHLGAIEVWNRKADRFRANDISWELKRRSGLPAVVGMDFHRVKQLFPLHNRLTLPSGFGPQDIPNRIGEILHGAAGGGLLEARAFGLALREPHKAGGIETRTA